MQISSTYFSPANQPTFLAAPPKKKDEVQLQHAKKKET
jgi:hypothetical protein